MTRSTLTADQGAPGRNVYTREEVAEMWGVNVRTVAREIERGRLKVFRVGRCIRITQGAIDEFMKGATA